MPNDPIGVRSLNVPVIRSLISILERQRWSHSDVDPSWECMLA